MGKIQKVKVGKGKRVERLVVAPKRKGKKPSNASRGSSSGPMAQIGMGIGSMFGGPAGGLVGMAAGRLISRITGFGDYKVDRNTVSNGNSVPSFTNGGKGMRCMHREYLSDIVGSVEFSISAYSINPGLVQTFPWLSLIAANFEEYDMEGLVFEYRPTSGTAVSSTSSALGVVILATDYDSIDPPFANKQQMESYEYATSTVPFTGCIHPVECLKKLNVLGSQYTRTGDAPPGTDLRLYDVGNFQIATQGMPSAFVVGELWVSYDVVFRKPRLPKSLSQGSYVRFISSPANSSATAFPFGASLVRQSDSSLVGVSSTADTDSFIISVSGRYYVTVQWLQGTGSVAATPPQVVLGSNLAFAPKFLAWNDPVSVLYSSNTSTNSNSLLAFVECLVPGVGIANKLTFVMGNDLISANCTVMVSLVNVVPSTLGYTRAFVPQFNAFRTQRIRSVTEPSLCELKGPSSTPYLYPVKDLETDEEDGEVIDTRLPAMSLNDSRPVQKCTCYA